ncbi:hypothetical protein SAMN05444392_10638 [Seinonella peptonophila]|uniref:Uncharacterized protein n=1 Tax=Seinonella peptonophila TaxID=112248 RepID=A0A1M4Y4M4_9BACL|nr:hypothetical protein [Seinonella peptonophila]SHF00645.1 hypothetical protein SAMN05444392_10638 [Seinonella peptonophila]
MSEGAEYWVDVEDSLYHKPYAGMMNPYEYGDLSAETSLFFLPVPFFFFPRFPFHRWGRRW